jgi:large subunit ribosomal protein L22
MKSFVNNHRQQPRKVRLVADMVRGKSVDRALVELKFLPKRATNAILKAVASAAANASHNFKVAPQDLIVKNITVEKGITLKRSMPMSRGRAFPIKKRTSRIQVTLAQK